MSHLYFALEGGVIVDTITAIDGQDAVEHFAEKAPDAVVLCLVYGQDKDKVKAEAALCGHPTNFLKDEEVR